MLHLFLGKGLLKMLSDEKPALMTVLEERIAAHEEKTAPAPTRFEGGVAPSAANDDGDDENENEGAGEGEAGAVSSGGIRPKGKGKGKSKSKAAADSDLLPRTNLGELITPELVAELDDKNWKVRAAALEQVGTLLSKHPRVSTDLGDLVPALQRRLGDSNKNLIMVTLGHLALLAEALGPAGKHVLGHIFAPILSNMADAKEQVRTACSKTLDAWAEQLDLEAFVEGTTIPEAMTSGKPYGQAGVMAWLTAQLAAAEDVPPLKRIVKPLFACLVDRSVDVRKAAQDLLTQVARGVSVDALRKVAGSLPDTSKSTVLDLIGKCSPPAPTAPKAVAVTSASVASKPGSGAEGKKPAARKGSKSSAAAGSGAATASAAPAASSGRGVAELGLLLDSGKASRVRDEKNHKVRNDSDRGSHGPEWLDEEIRCGELARQARARDEQRNRKAEAKSRVNTLNLCTEVALAPGDACFPLWYWRTFCCPPFFSLIRYHAFLLPLSLSLAPSLSCYLFTSCSSGTLRRRVKSTLTSCQTRCAGV